MIQRYVLGSDCDLVLGCKPRSIANEDFGHVLRHAPLKTNSIQEHLSCFHAVANVGIMYPTNHDNSSNIRCAKMSEPT
jgi:hypothetical protein